MRRLWAAVAATSMAVVGAAAVIGLNGQAQAAVGGTGTGYLSTQGARHRSLRRARRPRAPAPPP